MSSCNDLPVWLTEEQALSWVLFRAPSLPCTLSGFYDHPTSGRPPAPEKVENYKGERKRLDDALQSGRITFRQRQHDGTSRKIEGEEWGFGRQFAALVNTNPAVVRRADLVKEFPPLKRDRDKPALSDAALKRWWAKLTPDERRKPYDALLAMCREAHPENRITRDRARQFVKSKTPGRKPGPPQLRENRTA